MVKRGKIEKNKFDWQGRNRTVSIKIGRTKENFKLTGMVGSGQYQRERKKTRVIGLEDEKGIVHYQISKREKKKEKIRRNFTVIKKERKEKIKRNFTLIKQGKREKGVN